MDSADLQSGAPGWSYGETTLPCWTAAAEELGPPLWGLGVVELLGDHQAVDWELDDAGGHHVIWVEDSVDLDSKK